MLNKSSTVELLRSDKVFPFLVLPVTLVMPVIIIIVYFIRRGKIRFILEQKKMEGTSSA
jgi:hypothetical protein